MPANTQGEKQGVHVISISVDICSQSLPQSAFVQVFPIQPGTCSFTGALNTALSLQFAGVLNTAWSLHLYRCSEYSLESAVLQVL